VTFSGSGVRTSSTDFTLGISGTTIACQGDQGTGYTWSTFITPASNPTVAPETWSPAGTPVGPTGTQNLRNTSGVQVRAIAPGFGDGLVAPTQTFNFNASAFGILASNPGTYRVGVACTVAATPPATGLVTTRWWASTIEVAPATGAGTRNLIWSTVAAAPGAPTISTPDASAATPTVNVTFPPAIGAVTSLTATVTPTSPAGPALPAIEVPVASQSFPTTQASFPVPGLTPGTQYSVTVKANNSVGAGAVSNTLALTPPGATGPAWPDFNGDGSADRSVFRAEFGGWFVDGQTTEFLGLPGDIPVPGDYDGDDVTERAVYRAGAWYVEGLAPSFLGTATDVPVPGDYDGDGDWEPAVFRDGAWFIDGQATQFLGAAGDVPVPGDYDGDGATEIAVFRPSVGGWYVDGQAPVFFGLPTDIPVPADYTGDGITDRAVYRPEFGGWYVEGQAPQFIGLSTDVPVPADYNGDGSAERAVFRPEFGGWYVQGATTVFYGLGTDTPLPLPAAVYNTYFG
jgi:hypothetical protein